MSRFKLCYSIDRFPKKRVFPFLYKSVKRLWKHFSSTWANRKKNCRPINLSWCEGFYIQRLSRLLIRPEEPKLVDLISFVEMSRHDSVPFSDPTSKHSNVSHHSSVVVEIGVKHQGFERVSSARLRPLRMRSKEKKKKKFRLLCSWNGACGKKKKRKKLLRWNFVYNGLQNFVDISAMFCWYLYNNDVVQTKFVRFLWNKIIITQNNLDDTPHLPGCTPHEEYQRASQSETPLAQDQHFSNQSKINRTQNIWTKGNHTFLMCYNCVFIVNQ